LLHRLTGAHELPQAGSPYPGGSFSALADRGTRTASACSPYPGGEFFAEPQRGAALCGARGFAAPTAEGKKEGQPAVFLPLWTPTFPLDSLAQIADM